MINGLYTIDFHAHMQDEQTQASLCPDDRKSLFFQHAVPILERIANYSEPVHDEFVKYVALNLRDPFSRYLYSKAGQIGLMEVLRLFKNYDLNKLLFKMNLLNIDHVVIHSLEPLTYTRNILDITEPYKHKFSVFASVSRKENEPVKYLQDLINTGRISGIKIHPQVGGYACGELYEKTKDFAALAAKYNLPIMIHTGHIPSDDLTSLHGCSEVEAVEPLVREFQNVNFVLAHIGWESWRQVLKLAKSYKNIYVETSWQPANIIRRAVDQLGPGRVLFGSDFPLLKQVVALKQVSKALTRKELAYVMSANARSLLKLPHEFKHKAIQGKSNYKLDLLTG